MKKQFPVILIGDSLTEAFPVESLLSPFNVINKGVYGDYSEGVYARLETDVFSLSPSAVFLLIGTNDMARERTDDEICNSLSRIAVTLKKRLPHSKVFLTSILPTLELENRPNNRILRLNMRIQMICEELHCNYFNLHQHFVDDNGNLLKYYTPDGLHLNAEAYQHWASILRIHLLSQLINDNPEPINN